MQDLSSTFSSGWESATSLLKRHKLLLSALGVIFILALGFLLLLKSYLQEIVEKRAQEIAKKISTQLHVPVVYQEIELGLARVTFVGLAVGEGQQVIIDRADFHIGLNPLGKKFLKIEELELGRILVKDRFPMAESFAGIFAWLQKKIHGDKKSAGRSPKMDLPDRWKNWLPDRLKLRSGDIYIEDSQRKQDALKILGLKSEVDLRRQKLVLRAGETDFAGKFHEEDVELRGLLKKDFSSGEMLLRRRPENAKVPLWSVMMTGSRKNKSFEASFEGKELPLILKMYSHKIFSDSAAPEFDGNIKISKAADHIWNISIATQLQHILLENPRLSSETIGPFDGQLAFKGHLNTQRNMITFDNAIITLPNPRGSRTAIKLMVNATGFLNKNLSLSSSRWQMTASLPETPCQTILDTAPAGFITDLKGFSLEGTANMAIAANFDMNNLDDFQQRLESFNFRCNSVRVPRNFSSNYLMGPFVLERASENSDITEIHVDQRHSSFTPLAQLPSHVTGAFISAEDAGFWQHKGIEGTAITEAFRKNISQGSFAVGGSTITMQTVKNLFLSREKTLSRKAQELFLAWHLEQVLPKRRILEIYLNIIEFGPNIFGVTKAARYFFGKSPRELTLKEAVYLSSVLPAPIPRYRNFCNGRLTPNYQSLLDTLLRRMLALRKIDEPAFAAAINEPLRFMPASENSSCFD